MCPVVSDQAGWGEELGTLELLTSRMKAKNVSGIQSWKHFWNYKTHFTLFAALVSSPWYDYQKEILEQAVQPLFLLMFAAQIQSQQ